MSHTIDPSGPPPRRRLFSRKPKAAKGPKKPGRMKQIAEVFQMTRRNDPSAVWFMLLAFIGIIALGLLIGLLIDNVITLMIIAIPLAFLAAIFILSRRAERAAFSQIEGKPGAAGAALSVLRRGWILQEQPVAVNPRTQDALFRVIGRPGVILVSEGPSSRVKQLIDAERRKMARIIPNVPVHVIETGRDDRQVPLARVPKAVQKLKKTLTKQEVQAVDKRLSALGTKLPIPKGVDPFKARPDRKAMRGR
jgi:F0F1-type ATP synthase assembly protein I